MCTCGTVCGHPHVCLCVCTGKRQELSSTGCALSLFFSHSSPSWPTCVFQTAGLGCSSKSFPVPFWTSSSTTHSCTKGIFSFEAAARLHSPLLLLTFPASSPLGLQPLALLLPPSAFSLVHLGYSFLGVWEYLLMLFCFVFTKTAASIECNPRQKKSAHSFATWQKLSYHLLLLAITPALSSK